MARGLTPKQDKFAQVYIETGNASEAYRQAYNVRTTTENGVAHAAHKILNHPNVAARIKELQARHQKRHEVTVDRIIHELSHLGFANMMDYMRFEDNGMAFVDFSNLTREQAAAINSVEVDQILGKDDDAPTLAKIKFKLHDKRAALVDMGKHLGMFKEVHEITDKDGGSLNAGGDFEVVRRLMFAMARSLERRQSEMKTIDATAE